MPEFSGILMNSKDFAEFESARTADRLILGLIDSIVSPKLEAPRLRGLKTDRNIEIVLKLLCRAN